MLKFLNDLRQKLNPLAVTMTINSPTFIEGDYFIHAIYFFNILENLKNYALISHPNG